MDLLVQSQQLKQKNKWKIIEVNNEDTRMVVIDVVLVSVLLTLNRFDSFFWCFYC